tara:strand:+ start:11646 stop:12266 length:621 start_codon:yes stop_codon:yes gene_type:complete
MANEKFSDFTLETDLANFEGLVGFQAGVDNLQITPTNLGLHLPTRFMLSASYTLLSTAAGKHGLTWLGGNTSSGTSEDDGSLYIFQDFKINQIVMRYNGRTGIEIAAGESLSYELVTLDPTVVGPPAEWSIANDPDTSPNTLITDFGNVFDLDNADDGTWPYINYTPLTPIQLTADTMVILVQDEPVGTVSPNAADIMFYFDCQYT